MARSLIEIEKSKWVFLLAASLFVACGVPGPSGRAGSHEQGWFSTDLVGGNDWPPVALGSSFWVTAEVDAACSDNQTSWHGDDDDSADQPLLPPHDLTIISSDTSVISILGVEQDILDESEWAIGCEVHVWAQAKAVGEGQAILQLTTADGDLVDEIGLSIQRPYHIDLEYHGTPVDFPFGVIKGDTATIDGRLYNEDGRWLGHEGLRAVAEGGDDLVVWGDGERVMISAVGKGELHRVTVFVGEAARWLDVRPVRRATFIELAAVQVDGDGRRFYVWLALATEEQELILDPSYEITSRPNLDEEFDQSSRGFYVDLEDAVESATLTVSAPGVTKKIILPDDVEDEGSWDMTVERVLTAPPEEAQGCSISSQSDGNLAPLLVWMLAAMTFLRRGRYLA